MADVGGIAADALRQYVARIERLHEERAGLASDISDVFNEAAAMGFDKKVIREVIKIRRQNDRGEFDELVALYLHALGDAAGAADGVLQHPHARAAE